MWQNYSSSPPDGMSYISFLDAYRVFVGRVAADLFVVEVPLGRQGELEAFIRRLGGSMRSARIAVQP